MNRLDILQEFEIINLGIHIVLLLGELCPH